MAWELTLIRVLQKMSCGFMDFMNIAFTYLGDEIFFLVVAVVLFWCIDKKFAYKFMNVYLLSVAVNEGVKTIVKRARPYTVDGIASIGSKTDGYSFPSGHSQSIANISTQINMKYNADKLLRKIFLPLGIGLTVIVMFTRMYLGQHFLTDVIVGAALGIGLAVVFSYLYELLGDKEEWIAAGIVPICTIALIIVLALGLQGMGQVLNVLGVYTAISIGYFMEKKFIGYNVRSDKWWKYAIKVAIGLVITLALKEGLKFAFDSEQILLYNYLRYFLVGLWASVGCMALFKVCKL